MSLERVSMFDYLSKLDNLRFSDRLFMLLPILQNMMCGNKKWVNLSWLSGFHQTTLSLHLLGRIEGENIMEKLMGSGKDRDITFSEAILT